VAGSAIGSEGTRGVTPMRQSHGFGGATWQPGSITPGVLLHDSRRWEEGQLLAAHEPWPKAKVLGRHLDRRRGQGGCRF
jgi:hypothetical protein